MTNKRLLESAAICKREAFSSTQQKGGIDDGDQAFSITDLDVLREGTDGIRA
jgi:hypothetical protein